MSKRIALIGMGNIMFCDEGIGTYLAKYLESNYHTPENLTIVDGGLLGFSLMTYYQEYDKVIIVGTNSKEGEAGTIFHYSGEAMMAQSNTRQTANEVELAMMLEICSFSDAMGEVACITMIPEDIVSVKNGLSRTILEKMPHLRDAVLEALKEEGITLIAKEPHSSFENILHQCANPKNVRL